jgi:hypothetical protein
MNIPSRFVIRDKAAAGDERVLFNRNGGFLA